MRDAGLLVVPDGGYTLADCPSAGGVDTGCAACVEQACGSQVAAVDTACASVFACACPAGGNGAACEPSDDAHRR